MAGAYQILTASDDESIIEITLPERNGMQETLRFKIDGRVDSETIIRAIGKLKDNKIDALASKRGAISLSRYLQHSLLLQSDQLRGSASLRTYYRDTMIKVVARLTDSKIKLLTDNSFTHVCSLANQEHINSRSFGCVMNVLKSVFTKEQLKALGVQ